MLRCGIMMIGGRKEGRKFYEVRRGKVLISS